MSEDNSYANNRDGVHYVPHKTHCQSKGRTCSVIVGCLTPCLICEAAKRDIPLDDVCDILDKHYLNTIVHDPATLKPLVPEYIRVWDEAPS